MLPTAHRPDDLPLRGYHILIHLRRHTGARAFHAPLPLSRAGRQGCTTTGCWQTASSACQTMNSIAFDAGGLKDGSSSSSGSS